MAARLSEASAQKCELKLQLKRGSDGNDDEDGNFDEELDNLRNTVIECNEECGLLLFNVLQEFSLMKEVDLVHFPNLAFSRMIEQALAYFRKGMEICEGDDDANEVKMDGPSDAAARAVKEMAPLFDKRRPQVVAIWFSEYIPTAKKFEELNQRQMKYDYYRLKYWRFYIGMLQENMAYARLKEVGTWVLACKEEHDVISIMLGIVLQARGKVLRARLQGVMDTMRSTNVEVTATSESTDSMRPQLLGVDQLVDAVLKQLAKAYTYYLEVVDAQPRLTQVMEGSGLLLENAELPMVAVFFMGVTAYPSQMLLLEKDMVLMDRDFLNNVTVIKNALRRNELPPRIYDAEDREAWRKYLDAARSFCEEKWPERSGKGKVAKSRSRMKPSGGSTSETNTSQPAPDASS
ncbi:hypothetical protein BBO99_00003460 [Phytophthora kernoviae]|uniref:Uncharacterized protein n=1 Tax=Phytophthora kernoviae TaxID=325452 RepID=A0A3R7KL82_9STRA|nr:hypothetical protein JM18_004926 [Phytophthora kernoviae]KAG2525814.1 hypothetical protein JM16_003146 [Phytophthora kernoviae]RLN81746.1 hypothetical protein BBO99_00003460 [Phytophthora kernoviae]